MVETVKFCWNDKDMELEIIDPQHPTYVPLCGNRCWALIPTNLDWFCYSVNMPNWIRILKRIGLYIQVGDKRDSITRVLEKLKTFYGANYLRLTGEVEEVLFEIKVFPDVEQSILYIVASAENKADLSKDIKIMFAGDFELNPAPWGCKGFTEDATQDYSGLGRKINTPKDDKIKVEKDGSIFFVYDRKTPGVGFIASKKPSGWTLDRGKFSFETPMSGYCPNRGEVLSDVLDLSNEETSDDSLCVFQHDLCLQPSQKEIMPIITGYQTEQNSTVILETLKGYEDAFEKTKNFYQIPLLKGVKVDTPDPIINAQFNIFNVFIKMNEHKSGTRHAFLPAAHYYNWICGDSIFIPLGYSYTNDLEPIIDTINLYKRLQHEDGFIPNLPLWTEGVSWRERSMLSIHDAVSYPMLVCHVIKITRDKKFATEIFPSVKKAIDCALTCEKDGLIISHGEQAFDAIDWPAGFAHCPHTFVSALTYRGLMEMRDLASWLGEEDYAEEMFAKAEKLKKTINEKLWMEDRGYYRVGLPICKVGKDERDRQLFYQDMISWGSLVAVLWGVADKEKATRVIKNVRERLFTPYGLKFFDPPWVPSYADATGHTYEAGRVQNGAYWQCWWSIESFVRAEIMVGKIEEAFKDFLEIRLDTIYHRFKMKEKGKELSFLRAGEWTDTDLTFPVTSIPYPLTAAFFNQTLIESILGIKVGYEEIRVEPHLPSSWNGARVSNLKLGDSEWTIEIHGKGNVKQILLDGAKTETIPITSGKHHIEIKLTASGR